MSLEEILTVIKTPGCSSKQKNSCNLHIVLLLCVFFESKHREVNTIFFAHVTLMKYTQLGESQFSF